jgi:aminoglycoside/choline kinase family phosphotransferase
MSSLQSPNRSHEVDPESLHKSFPLLLSSSGDIKEISRLAGDASSRSYYRISVKNPDLTSCILQTAEPFPGISALDHPFLAMQSRLQKWGVRVPEVLGWESEKGWIVLEDLGDVSLQDDFRVEYYEAAIREIHTWTLKSQTDFRPLLHYRQTFDWTKLNFEMEFMAEHLCQRLLGADAQRFLALVRDNTEYLVDRPRFLCHRDYHARNLMIKDGQPYVIDFQDARMGPVTYDIASLLWDPYVRLSELNKAQLLTYWRQGLDAHEETRLPADWETELERMKVQRLLKACGSYASFYNLKGRRDYLPSVRPAMTDVLVSLGRIDGGAVLADFLRGLDIDAIDRLAKGNS